jgi:DMSO/TMAO reductase YedYZ molybdopterin-dependent catalytic subunit
MEFPTLIIDIPQKHKFSPGDTFTFNPALLPDDERNAFIELSPAGFQIRHPPPPHELTTNITPDAQLFQTSHMGIPLIGESHYRLIIDGLIPRPFSITFEQLKSLPATTITAFHECYGSPLKSPLENCLRIGNVKWTGVKVSDLLALAGYESKSSKSEHFVWSEGLDRGTFADVKADRYQKDLPMSKAMKPEVMAVYAMNGEPLNKKRGGPVRLVVPGWFGTNSVKWLCKLSVQDKRAPGPFTTTFYNIAEQGGTTTRPVWKVNVNSMIVRPTPNELTVGPDVLVWGWAWADDGVKAVHVLVEDEKNWHAAEVDERIDRGWQKFEIRLNMPIGRHKLIARALSFGGEIQPLEGWRNHAHHVDVMRTK